MMNSMLSGSAQMPNGYVGARGPTGAQQAQLQAFMQSQARLPPQGGQENARVIMEASRLSEQQRKMAERQYAAAGGLNPPSSQNMANIGLPMQPSAAMMASAQAAASGKLSPANGVGAPQPRPSSSPRSSNGTHAGSLSSGTVPVLNQIANTLRSMHPHASPDQIKQMATSHLSQSLRSSNSTSSMVGGNNSANGMGASVGSGMQQLSPQPQPAALAAAAAAAAAYGGGIMNPQLYAQYMRSQQASQQNRMGDGTSDRGSLRPESRGATPAHGSRTSQSPHIPQAQITGS